MSKQKKSKTYWGNWADRVISGKPGDIDTELVGVDNPELVEGVDKDAEEEEIISILTFSQSSLIEIE